MRLHGGWLAVVAFCSACSSYAVTPYGVSVANVAALKQTSGQTVGVKLFTATGVSKTEINCRAVGPVKTPDGQPFEEYIRKAFIDELKVADLYSESSPVTLGGNLDQIDFSSTSGNWVMGVTLKSSNGRSLAVTNTYSYETSFVGEKACALSAQAFGPAVQALVGKIVNDPEFAGLLK
jgi:hypothetical protein